MKKLDSFFSLLRRGVVDELVQARSDWMTERHENCYSRPGKLSLGQLKLKTHAPRSYAAREGLAVPLSWEPPVLPLADEKPDCHFVCKAMATLKAPGSMCIY
jgi:hypothetical protein